jgi:putative PIN family toxin of toxin-antitoxin system
MRVVLDTNLLISALFTPESIPDALYRAWREGRFTLVTSEAQLEEFRRATRYPALRRFITPAAAGTMHNELQKLAIVIADLPTVDASKDPADNFLLATALKGKADYLATGDKRGLLAPKTFEHTRIVTARRLLKVLGVAIE